MEAWQTTSLILCAFGLFKEFRPSEPFFTPYLVEYKNITQDSLIHTAYPVWTYTYLGTLAIVFLITDFLRYRSVVIFEGFAYVCTWIILTWGKDLTAVIFVEIGYGIACSTEVAYYTYIYAKVDREHYKKVTSYTYSAILVGRFLGALTSQLLVSFDLMDYHELNYFSLACVSTALIFSLFLPGVKQSIYFHREDQKGETTGGESLKKISFVERVKKTYPILWKDFKEAYSTSYVIKWSIWWAIATAGHLQIFNYIQALWKSINDSADQEVYNGAVEAIHTLLSAILAFGVGFVKLPWFKWGEVFLSFISVIQGGVLILMALTESLNVAYICYIVFRTLYQVMITVASAEVAERISADSYGLIFGINTFLALLIQTILTVVVADDIGLALNERDQYLVYGGYYTLLGAVFLFVSIYTFCKYGLKGPPNVIKVFDEAKITDVHSISQNNNIAK